MTTGPEAGRRRLELLRRVSHLMDESLRVPGTRFRFGLDALVGLVPGAGDTVSALVSGLGIVAAASSGAPAFVIARMLLNVGLDTLIGAVPLVGDVFDVVWKSNRRNLDLFERWLERPHHAARRSTVLLAGTGAAVLVLVAASAWVAWRVVAWTVGAIRGLIPG